LTKGSGNGFDGVDGVVRVLCDGVVRDTSTAGWGSGGFDDFGRVIDASTAGCGSGGFDDRLRSHL
jgi:hypothetical protein